MKRGWWVLGLFVMACSAPASPAPDMETPTPDMDVVEEDETPDVAPDVAPDLEEDETPDLEEPAPVTYPIEDCDPIMPSRCSLPWPSNQYLAPDTERATGYTLRFGSKSLPRNKFGRWPDPAPFERLDGYGLGSPVQLHFPNIDLTGMAAEDSIERSVEDTAPIVWFQVVKDGAPPERIPYFVERDLLAEDPADALVFVRPAVLLKPNARQIVALRGLKTTDGAAIAPSEAFEKLRRSQTEGEPTLRPRQEAFDRVFTLLESQGIDRDSLTLAWDFHTASTDGLHADMLHMRDEAFELLDRNPPTLTVVRTREFAQEEDGSGRDVNEFIAVEMDLTFEVPHYMKPRGTGFEFNREDGKPTRTGARTVDARIRVPWGALEGRQQGLILYGHGLFGDVWEVRQGYLGLIGETNDSIIVGLNLVGMSDEDSSAAQDTVLSLMEFVKVADRLHQGILEHLIMARYGERMLTELKELGEYGVVFDEGRIQYMGASQGGIFGGTILALSPDVHRGVLIVPGNNYATMLHRSVNFDQFQEGLEAVFEDDVELAMIPSLLQLLWDGTEQSSYLRHLVAEPLPGNPAKEALFLAARGDKQVSVLTNEIMSRSDIGIPIVGDYDTERTPWNVPNVGYPHTGSGYVLVDVGNPWPAWGNLPPMTELSDPHGRIEEFEGAGPLFLHYLNTGEMLDQCADAPCKGTEAAR